MLLEITPSGYAQMTHMLNALSGGKMLVILEGGYNLRSISSSATAVIKVLLGDSRVCELENSFPSKSGLQTVFEVLDIQNNFWPSLKPIFMNVMSLWKMYCLGKK
ncbi:histone deacetylase 15-like, partial [Trifolium medium]|nr:histone deacetylase 15-like [Trifolium medium]